MTFGLPKLEKGLVTVTLAIPTASIAVIFEYKTGEQETASTLFWSMVLSLITIGAFIFITGS